MIKTNNEYMYSKKVKITRKVCENCGCEAFSVGSHICGYCGTKHDEAAKADEIDTINTTTRTCRECGCDDLHACEGGCFWVGLDLCSQCYSKLSNLSDSMYKILEKERPIITRELIKLLKTEGINSKAMAIEILENLEQYEV